MEATLNNKLMNKLQFFLHSIFSMENRHTTSICGIKTKCI